MPGAVELRDIRKTFGRSIALDGVSLRVEPASILGLLGENGAGKSTLMNILFGLLRPDSGEILFGDEAAVYRSPADAIALGIGMVHQHFMLVPAMSVLDNVLLGDRRQGRMLDRGRAAKQLLSLSHHLDLEIDPSVKVERLSVGQQQRVEILKALWRDVKVLILDEPTAVLTPQEARQLLKAMRKLRSAGRSIIFISHKIDEVLSVCDRLVVLRRGKVAWAGATEGASAPELARHMVGQELAVSRMTAAESRPGTPILRLAQARTEGIEATSLEVSAEIFGIAGVDGNGQQALAEMLVGLRPVVDGRIDLCGMNITHESVAERAKRGVAHVPADRKHEGLVISMRAAENVALKHHREPPMSRLGWMSWGRIELIAQEACSTFGLRGDTRGPVALLSGGNQQKVVLARELGIQPPRLLIAHNPTRGLDIAATRFVHEQLARLRARGCAIVLISTELDELLTVCDRIGVLYRGRLTLTDFPSDGLEQIGRLMAGGRA